MKVTNQKPVVLLPIYNSPITGDMDIIHNLTNSISAKLFTPLVANTPVRISSNGNTVTVHDITQYIISCCQPTVDIQSETVVKKIFQNTLAYFDETTSLGIQNTFSIQSAVKEKLPFPDSNTIYTPATDVIPTAREFLAGQCDYDKFFASLAFYARPNTLGFYFANDTAFDAFKAWFKNQINVINSVLPAETNQLCADFDKLTLDKLTESLILRHNDNDNNQEYSFARTLIAYLMQYSSVVSNAEFGILPFELGELYCPRTVVFVNVEQHAHSTARQIADEWAIINKSLNMPIKIISNNKLAKLTAAVRNINRIQSSAAIATTKNATAQRAVNVRFRKTAPTTVDVIKLVQRVMSKMATVAKSENTYKSMKMTFAKPNRRDPDDFNKQGKIVSTKYRPDIHLYIDTSGSISERNYQDAVKACIKMARSLNINLYFNSFSHVLSQCVHLKTKDKSTKAVYAEFSKIHKVTGGTDYEQIWHYINKSKKRRRELSLVLTDFEYFPPNHYVKHPDNIYYIPCSHMDWDSITSYAKSFCKSMTHIDSDCRKHILF